MLMLVIGMLLAAHPLHATPLSQSSTRSAEVVFPVVSPGAATTATLHTHVAAITLDADAQGVLAPRLIATYDIRNDGKDALQLPLTITGAEQFDLSITQDGTALEVTSTADGRTTATIIVPANGRVDVTLTASRTTPDQPLLRIIYPTELLRQWRGQRSVRIDLIPGDQSDPASWLNVEPETWRYAASDAAQLEWLFESEVPVRILFQMVAPYIWQEMQSLHANAIGHAPDVYAALGQRYQTLADTAAQLGDGDTQARFLAQATAAYTEGIRQGEAAGVAAVDLADLHAGLAALYRARVSVTGHVEDAQALVIEAGLALAGVMVDDPRRGELEQWQVEGLRLMLADLRRRGDIPGALALIEQLQTLPAGVSGSDFLAQERQALVVQQAVQLIEQGDRSTALALAGDLIQAPALQPPAEYRNLFARWNVSTELTEAGTAVRITATASDDHADAAQTALDAVVQTWREAPATRASEPQVQRVDSGDAAQFALTLQLPAGENGVALANTLPVGADWALLRILLGQLGPQIEARTEGLWQQVQVSQPIDLRAVGEQWQRLAAELDRQAAQFEADATSAAAADMQASQEARLRAANYRTTAQAWRKLAQDSQVLISLATPGAVDAGRSWLVTVASPPQMLDVQVAAPSPVRLLLAGLAVLTAIIGLTALLWRLL